MYVECIDLFVSFLLFIKGVYVDLLFMVDKDEGVINSELFVLDVLIKVCKKGKFLNIDVYLNCYRRKL